MRLHILNLLSDAATKFKLLDFILFLCVQLGINLTSLWYQLIL